MYRYLYSRYLWAGALVVLGIYLNLMGKNNKLDFNCRKCYVVYSAITNVLSGSKNKSHETTV